ncbi:hypothetical protein BKA80DRAFT_23539 [Phyllosticta citrichinensis]
MLLPLPFPFPFSSSLSQALLPLSPRRRSPHRDLRKPQLGHPQPIPLNSDTIRPNAARLRQKAILVINLIKVPMPDILVPIDVVRVRPQHAFRRRSIFWVVFGRNRRRRWGDGVWIFVFRFARWFLAGAFGCVCGSCVRRSGIVGGLWCLRRRRLGPAGFKVKALLLVGVETIPSVQAPFCVALAL